MILFLFGSIEWLPYQIVYLHSKTSQATSFINWYYLSKKKVKETLWVLTGVDILRLRINIETIFSQAFANVNCYETLILYRCDKITLFKIYRLIAKQVVYKSHINLY